METRVKPMTLPGSHPLSRDFWVRWKPASMLGFGAANQSDGRPSRDPQYSFRLFLLPAGAGGDRFDAARGRKCACRHADWLRQIAVLPGARADVVLTGSGDCGHAVRFSSSRSTARGKTFVSDRTPTVKLWEPGTIGSLPPTVLSSGTKIGGGVSPDGRHFVRCGHGRLRTD